MTNQIESLLQIVLTLTLFELRLHGFFVFSVISFITRPIDNSASGQQCRLLDSNSGRLERKHEIFH